MDLIISARKLDLFALLGGQIPRELCELIEGYREDIIKRQYIEFASKANFGCALIMSYTPPAPNVNCASDFVLLCNHNPPSQPVVAHAFLMNGGLYREIGYAYIALGRLNNYYKKNTWLII